MRFIFVIIKNIEIMIFYTPLYRTFNTNFIGFATMIVLSQSCLGGVAAMSILANGTSLIQMVQLSAIVFISIITNTSILAQLKHKTIFNLSLTSVVTSILLIIINSI